jgi:disease resistance protein RPM1
MDLATGAMGSLLVKLDDLLTQEYKLQTGVKEDIEYMKRELTSMYSALRKVGDVPRDQLDQQVKSWVDEVRDLSYMMEDIIEKFLVCVEGAEPAVKPCKLKQLM